MVAGGTDDGHDRPGGGLAGAAGCALYPAPAGAGAAAIRPGGATTTPCAVTS
jgi:hypothetical protein